MFFSRTKQVDISKETIMSYYDDNFGVKIIVNATEKEVDIPEKFRNETKLHLDITRESITAIYFYDDRINFIIKIESEEHKCTVPYIYIRNASPILSRSSNDFWRLKEKTKEKYKLYANIIEVFFWIFFLISLVLAVYCSNKNISFFEYHNFDVLDSLWNGKTKILGKFASIWVAVFESMWVLAISPVMLIAEYFKLSNIWTETLVIINLSLIVGLVSLQDKLRAASPEEKTLTELNLELLGLRPIFKKRQFNINNNFCFYVGPFSEEYTSIYIENVYTPLNNIGIHINRSDEIFGTRPVMDDIWECINEASLIIAEISGRNPNVMYEIGMAHTIGKKVIILTQDMKDVPFDLHGYRYIIYENTDEGRNELGKKLILTVKKELGINKL